MKRTRSRKAKSAQVSVGSPSALMGSRPYGSQARDESSWVMDRIAQYRADLGRGSAVQARRGSYRSTNNQRSRVATTMGGTGDQHADPWSRRLARELSRDLIRNADSFRVLHQARVRAVIGTGVRPRATSTDPEWNRIVSEKMDERYKATKGGIDARQIANMYQMQASLAAAMDSDGDVAFLKLSNMTGQILESEQITGGPNGLSGVEGITLDAAGRPTAFHFAGFNILGIIDPETTIEASPLDVEFIANTDRHSQTRGMPLLIAALDDWERLDSYRESEIVAAEQGANIFGAIQQREGDFSGRLALSGEIGSQVANSGVQPSGFLDWQANTRGALIQLPDGKTYVPIDPKRPNPNCAPFMMELLRQFCGNSGLPYEWVYNDLRGLSWSINRALIQQARDQILTVQVQRFAPAFSSIYLWQLRDLVKTDPDLRRMPLPDGWQRHEHEWPVISWPDEGKEYEAQAHGLAHALTTHQRIHGAAWQHVFQERADALRQAAILARSHNKEFPEFEVDPYFFLGFGPTDATASSQKEQGGPLSEAQVQQRKEAAERSAENRTA